MATLSGNDVSIYKRTSTGPDVYKLIVCAIDATLSMNREVIESKTKCGTTRKAGTKSWEMTISGEVETAPTSDQISIEQLFADFDQDNALHYAFKSVDGTFGWEGNAVVTALEISSPTDDTVKFSATLSGDGDIVVLELLPTGAGDAEGLWAWYKADAGVTGTTEVTIWADQSTNGNDLVSVGAGFVSKVDSVLNSLPVIDNNGTAYMWTNADQLPVLTTGTIYMVARQMAADGSAGAFLATVGSHVYIERDGTNNAIAAGSGGAVVSGAVTNDTFYSIRVRLTSTNIYISINNGTEVSASRSTSGLTAAALTVFRRASTYGDKQIAELIIYTENHSSDVRTVIESYLQTKYNHY